MRSSVKKVASLIVLLAALGSVGMAQIPLQTKISFDVNVPYSVRMGKDLMLAPGHYVLFQNSENPDLFALYPGSLKNSPIAQIFTNQTPYWADKNRGTTKVELKIDERGNQPVLAGWTVPFDARRNIVSVVAKPDGAFITRVM
ncbi:MAG TPA: hypothetical protein VI756_22645 [Blastocatellia bacterium]